MAPYRIPQNIVLTLCVILMFVITSSSQINEEQTLDDLSFLNCGKGCLNCTQTQCFQCDQKNHWEIDQGKLDCKCIDTYYISPQNLCKSCEMIGCLHCQNTQKCIQCNANDHWIVNESHHCECQPHYFDKSSKCQSCQEGCLICSDNKSCISCDQANHYQMDNNLCVCKEGYYNDRKEHCLKCQIKGCKHCFEDPSGCKQCFIQKHFIHANNTCYCVESYYPEHQSCANCMLGCKICLQKQKCIQCNSSFIKRNDQCICEQGKFLEEGKCFDCISHCATCSTINECTVCKQGYDLEDNICYQGGLSTLAIILIAVGGVVLVGVVIVAGVFCWLKLTNRKRSSISIMSERPSVLQQESLTGSLH